jgi:hypothetical protein
VTHEGIEKLIDALNAGVMRDRIFLSSLTDRVDSAHVWLEEPRGGIANEGSQPFYCIKNVEGTYVGSVLDMYDDLHAVIKKEHRGRNHLYAALNDVVFPKLFQDGRETQRVTFENSKVAEYCVRRFGFRMTAPLSAEKDLSIFSAVPKIEFHGFVLTQDDVRAMELNINRAKLYIKMVKERVVTAYGNCDELRLDELVYDDIGNLGDRIHGFMERRRIRGTKN